MESPTILITGATGRTGHSAIETLVKKGLAVRALAHHEGPKAEKLRALGAEVVVGDLFNLDQVVHAMSGIESAYFIRSLPV
jgi:NAD(P)H dehydrogenase (quinone)